MLTMIGLARKYPMIHPWIPVRTALKTKAAARASVSPCGRTARNTIADADNVAPRAKDMILPLTVMNVMPTAGQPINDVVVSNEKTLTGERKPGVVTARAARMTRATTRIAMTISRRFGSGRRNPPTNPHLL